MPGRPAATAAAPRRAIGRGTAGGGRGLLVAVAAALVAGAVAITVNILVLDGFDAAGVVTARGGLRNLVRAWLSGPLTRAGVDGAWTPLGLPGPDAAPFKTGFKVGVGLLMALAYALLLEPVLPGGRLRKGLLAAIPFWLLNTMAVRPSWARASPAHAP